MTPLLVTKPEPGEPIGLPPFYFVAIAELICIEHLWRKRQHIRSSRLPAKLLCRLNPYASCNRDPNAYPTPNARTKELPSRSDC
jgi:hypothetical protein